MMSEKSEDDQENADSKTATIGLYCTATQIHLIELTRLVFKEKKPL